MYCERCGNTDEKAFGVRGGKVYCKKCLLFTGKTVTEEYVVKPARFILSYSLSKQQQDVSNCIIKAYEERRNCLIYAVTGAGKTELVFGIIERLLNIGKRVGFAVPRVDIVIDLLPRFKMAFPTASIVGVYGEHCGNLVGDIILLTTHQLYRYTKFFDLLIMDEIDAFPFAGNEQLNHFFKNSIRGNYVLMSATPSKSVIEEMENTGGVILKLMNRYHGHKLPVPIYRKTSCLPKLQVAKKVAEFILLGKPVLVFVPTIEKGINLYSTLRLFLDKGRAVSSESVDRKEIIGLFKTGELDYLVTTTILERGVTVKGLQVIIYMGENSIYSASTIIQMAGRVGRKIGEEDGEVIIYAKKRTREIDEAISTINHCNQQAGL